MNSGWAWLYVAAVLVPLGAFVVEFVLMRALGRLNAYLATAAIAASCVLSAVGFVGYLRAHPGMLAEHGAKVEHPDPGPWTLSTEWVALGAGLGEAGAPALRIPLGIHIDGLAATMFLMVTFVATLIHVYSMGYMAGDPGYPRFFAFLSLFCFSMLGLVASASIFLVFVFWELVGLCSYLLIGYWYREKPNTDAANKAFIVNRVGDAGMIVGLGLLWSSLGTFSIAEINRSLRGEDGRLHVVTADDGTPQAELRDRATGRPVLDPVSGAPRRMPTWLLALAGLGVFAGCMGKSAQFPLHVWLPDAMAGPTPVSALIHAATMVAAGVYLVGRFYPLFTDAVLLYIAYTGAATLLIGATIAMVQTDYKKVLAYSTVSQLGFMMLGLGVGGWAAGLFHLLTHASFKALLFLGAGSVHHAVHTYEMAPLGGLYPKMRVTAITMLLGTLAIAGCPFFSGFYSKDAILGNALHFAIHQPGPGGLNWLLFVVPVLGAMLTAFYMFRMWFLIFDGRPRGYPAPAVAEDTEHAPGPAHHGSPFDHAHESPGIMTWPLILLAVPTVAAGWPVVVVPGVGFEPLLEQLLAAGAPRRAVTLGALEYWAIGGSLLIFAAGAALGAGYYSRWRVFSPEAGAARFGPLYRFFVNKWYFDDLYRRIFVRPVLGLAALAGAIDKVIIDGLINGSAWFTEKLSEAEGRFDLGLVDAVVNLVGDMIYTLGDEGRRLQTGRLRNYLMVLAVGLVLLFAGMFAWIR